MRIDVATKEEVWRVAHDMRPRDLAEFLAVSPAESREELADLLAEKYGDNPGVLCAREKAVGPIAIGGMMQIRPNVSSLMFYANEHFPRIAISMTKFIRDRLFPRYREAGVHRIECISLDGYDDVHRWIGMLGLEREAGPIRGFGKNGEDFVQFAWVDPDVRAPGN